MSCGWCPETKTINTLTTPVSLPFELYCFLSAVQCTLTLALMRRSHDTIRLMFGADSTSNRSKRLQEARLERKQRELQRFGEGLALALQRLQRARSTRYRQTLALSDELFGKAEDLVKLKALLSQRNIQFCPPIEWLNWAFRVLLVCQKCYQFYVHSQNGKSRFISRKSKELKSRLQQVTAIVLFWFAEACAIQQQDKNMVFLLQQSDSEQQRAAAFRLRKVIETGCQSICTLSLSYCNNVSVHLIRSVKAGLHEFGNPTANSSATVMEELKHYLQTTSYVQYVRESFEQYQLLREGDVVSNANIDCVSAAVQLALELEVQTALSGAVFYAVVMSAPLISLYLKPAIQQDIFLKAATWIDEFHKMNPQLPPSNSRTPPSAWLFGNLLQVMGSLESLTVSARHALLIELQRLLGQLPDDFFMSATPAYWVRTGAVSSSEAVNAALCRQMSRLTNARVLVQLGNACCRCDESFLPNPGLLAPDSDDNASASASGGSDMNDSSFSFSFNSLRSALTSSSWAKKLFRTNSSATTAAAIPNDTVRYGQENLIDTSSHSKALARGMHAAEASRTEDTATAFDIPLFEAFCELFCYILCRCGWANSQSGSKHVSTGAAASILSSSSVLNGRNILNVFAFSPVLRLTRKLWAFIGSYINRDKFVSESAFPSCFGENKYYAQLLLFSASFAHQLSVLDELDLYERGRPLPRRETAKAIEFYVNILGRANGFNVSNWTWSAKAKLEAEGHMHWRVFQHFSVAMLLGLYDRHARMPLGNSDIWVIACERNADVMNRLMTTFPFAVPFAQRAAWFNSMRLSDKEHNQSQTRGIRIVVQRAHIFDTAYNAITRISERYSLRNRLHVSFIDEFGNEEAGIDAGGLFKELWTQLAAVVFDPSYGLFALTASNQMYPNPAADLIVGSDTTKLFEFLGLVLGKALYEGVVVQPQFTHFFLARLLNKPINLHHLPSLDEELYRNLMFLKSYEGDAADLALTFSISIDFAGKEQEIELISGGSRKDVTNGNKLEYIYRVAYMRMFGIIKKQCEAFQRGFYKVISPQWLNCFSEPELQQLISGATSELNVDNLQAHTQYTGGYTSLSRPISKFWKIVRQMSAEDKAALLRFVTACERAPPLGFADLHPQFTIQRVPDTDRLPSASTCFNILKLPAYSSASDMKRKLETAIRSNSGFNLS